MSHQNQVSLIILSLLSFFILIFVFFYLFMKSLSTKKNEHPQVIKYSIEATVSLDCIKLCPYDDSLWAFAYYQQLPHFQGGIQVLQTQSLKNISQNIYEMGPIMHIQWLHKQQKSTQQNHKYNILAAHREDKISFLVYDKKQKNIKIWKSIILAPETFCLYCHWVFNSQKNTAMVAVSTNQSTVYQLEIGLNSEIQAEPEYIHKYQKHQYAVWACRLNYDGKYLVTGDEVNSLYLYDTTQKALISKNSKAHEQGICEIIFFPKSNLNMNKFQYVLTGSFDGSLAKINLQNFNIVLQRYQIGGTIWRIIPLPKQSKQENDIQSSTWLICNSSQKVFQIIQENQQSQKKYDISWNSKDQHNSLAYAADWNSECLVTCSYYDKQIRIWEYCSD